jgi:hypothetical protein
MNAFAIEEGFILTNDEERELTFEGAKIQVMPVWKWLRNLLSPFVSDDEYTIVKSALDHWRE